MSTTQRPNPELNPEIQLLSALVVSPNLFTETVKLEADDFEDVSLGAIFGRMRDLYNSGLVCSCYELPGHFVDVEELSGHTEAEIKKFFFNLARTCVLSLLDVPSLVRTIRYSGAYRKLSILLIEAQTEAKKKELEPLITELQEKLAALSMSPENQKSTTTHAIAREIIADMDAVPQIYSTGLEALDNAMGGGVYGGKCYALAARKKSGKTACLATIAQNFNLGGVKAIYIALEMGRKEIMHRIIARGIQETPMSFLNGRKMEVDFREKVDNFVANNPRNLHFIDKAGIGFEELQRELILAFRKFRPQVVILDYWQLVSGKQNGQSTSEHLDNVAQWLASFAKEYGPAIIAASQMNQDGNTRGSEGLRLAFDQVYEIHRIEGTVDETPKVWIEMMDTRYTTWRNCGTESFPAFNINTKGVFFEEIDYVAAMPAQMSAGF